MWCAMLSRGTCVMAAICGYLSFLQESGTSVEQKVQDALLSAFGKLKKDPIVCVDMQTKMVELGLAPFFPTVTLPPYAAVCSGLLVVFSCGQHVHVFSCA